MDASPHEPNLPDATNVLPDETFVVRGGLNLLEDLADKILPHPGGIVGLSVHSAVGLTIPELAVGIPNGQIGVTTVAKVRAAGGDVIPTSGRSPYHATLTRLTPEQVHRLLTPTIPNPAVRRPRGRR